MPKRSAFPKFESPTYKSASGYDRAILSTDLPTMVTLFSGLGSSSLAGRKQGHDVLAHDFLPEAVASLNANGFNAVGGDIRAVDFTDPIYRCVQVLAGGPPCQPFSQSGRNEGQHDARDMVGDYIRALRDIRPRFFILENVRGLAGPRHREYLESRIAEIEALGYKVDFRVLDCADYGAGQNRKRLFVIGSLDGAPRWPSKIRRQRTMAEVLGWTRHDCYERNLLAPEPAHVTHEGPESLACWPMRRPATTVVGSFRPEVQAAPGYRSAGDGPRQNAPGSVVTTQAERLTLQQMPTDWVVKGSTAKQDLQIGNTCPNGVLVALLEANGW